MNHDLKEMKRREEKRRESKGKSLKDHKDVHHKQTHKICAACSVGPKGVVDHGGERCTF
jgi:hypothetical protein